MWVIYAFGSSFFAGITAILAKIGIKNVDSNLATALRTILILIFSWIIVFMTGAVKTLCLIDLKTMLFLILSGLATGMSWLCYFKALQLADVNKVTPIDKSSTILTMILAILFLGEEITLLKIISIILIGSGTYLMIEKKEESKQTIRKTWLIYALLSALFASLTSILAKIGIENIDSNLATAIRTIVVLLMAWIVVFVTKKQDEIKSINKKNMKFILLSGLTTGLSWLLYYKALQQGQAGIVAPIDKLSIVFTIAFSYFVLKEKLNKKSFLGLIEILIGTFILLL
ncbi:EamA family transporter [Anaerofustis sp. LCP19S3_F7]|uniref:EamA family transporter n=1 Tax=Anaerofustis sp. LCP19S3_F7 TaxID=3440247 RepID=UPI003F923054